MGLLYFYLYLNAGSWTESLVMEPNVMSKLPYQPNCADILVYLNNKVFVLRVNESGNWESNYNWIMIDNYNYH
jgi:hypothetical protein